MNKHRMEAQLLIEDTGKYYEDEIDNVMDIYDDVVKNIGFEDNRNDSRFVVKFHDIFYYIPDEYEREHEDELDSLFEDFCATQYDWVMDDINEHNVDIRAMLASRPCGHYDTFIMNIDNITQENAVELAMEIYDEVGADSETYASDYVTVVNILQDLEDNYMEYWFDFIDGAVPDSVLKEMRTAYNNDKERRK